MDFEQRFSKVGRYLDSDFIVDQGFMNREWVSENDNDVEDL